ncbi:hypothetical protein AB1Y20_002067 [Prymnesium parvum]|uniref:Uncharacterized protein n=1 Tax=Prymnesium parvum TaxID=97485 RepID=A0AB34J8D3_PRYPA
MAGCGDRAALRQGWCVQLARDECERHFLQPGVGAGEHLRRPRSCVWSAVAQRCEAGGACAARLALPPPAPAPAPPTRCCEWVGPTERVPRSARCGEPDAPPPADWKPGIDAPPNRTRVLRIVANHGSAGFFAYMLFVVNQLLFADKLGLAPVVELGRCTVNGHDHFASGGANLYYDERRGPNVWEYYFEPVTPVERVAAQMAGALTLPSKTLWWLHHQAKGSVYAHYYGRYAHKRRYDERWHLRMRRRAHGVLAKYVRLKPALAAEVDAFWARRLAWRRPVLGVHLRGTDKQRAIAGDAVHPAAYAPHIDAYLAAHGNATLFVATDSPSFLGWLAGRYPRQLVYRAALRSEANAFLDRTLADNYRKGADALVDAQLLSRADFLLKCSSALGEFAVYFNPSLHARSLDVQLTPPPPPPPAAPPPHAAAAAPLPPAAHVGCVLRDTTDLCASFVQCDAAAPRCPAAAPLPLAKEAYGIFRGMFASLPLHLPRHARPLLSAVLAEAGRGCARTVGVSLARCREPILPLAFALAARAPAGACVRLAVREECHGSPPTRHVALDARDRLLDVRRVSTAAAPLAAAAAAHARAGGGGGGGEAAWWFVPRLSPAAAARLLDCAASAAFWESAEATLPAAAAALRVSGALLASRPSAAAVEAAGGAAPQVACAAPPQGRRLRAALLLRAAVCLVSHLVRLNHAPPPPPPPPLPPHAAAAAAGYAYDCVEPDFMLYNRVLPPLAFNLSLQCTPARPAAAASRRLRAALHARCAACACSSMLRTALLPAGWFSTLHGLLKPAMHALRAGRTLLPPPLPHFAPPRLCARADLGCFFDAPAAACDGNASDAAPLNLRDDAFTRSLSHHVHGAAAIPAAYRPHGWFWWVSHLLHALLRPAPRLQRAVAAAMDEAGLGAALAAGRVVGLHVRHGDACLRKEQRRMARTCTPLAAYMRAAAAYAGRVGATAIYLATDSERVLAETSRYPAFTFLYLRNISRARLDDAAPPALWDQRVVERARADAVEQNFVDAWQATVDAALLSKCDVFVGKFTSNFFRTAYALKSASCDCIAPFVSLDAPWCFDYGLRVGSNWEFPVASGKPGVAGAADNRFWC